MLPASDFNDTAPTRKPVGRAMQATEGKRADVRISAAAIARIVRALQNGEGEQGISRREGISEAEVRRIRTHALARVERAIASVRLGLRDVIELVNENEREHWQEFTEAA